MNESTSLKCWVVRNSALSIQFGGMERLFAHFSKPRFNYRRIQLGTGDSPFNEPTEKCGLYKEAGWENRSKTWVQPLSVGNWIGYDNQMSTFIWKKLCEHFNNEPFEKWDEMEREGVVKQEDFCLELDLTIGFSEPKE